MTIGAVDAFSEAWRRLLGEPPNAAAPPLPAEARARLDELIGSALAHDLLDAGGNDAAASANAIRARQSLLLNRLTRHRQLECLEQLAAAGVEVVAMKGFATAHTLYQDPDLRVTGDLDILVRRAQAATAARLFLERGFRVATDIELSRWGFISEASFLPIVSADGIANIDIHVEPDCYPLHRGLETDAVFAAARAIQVSGLALRIPAPEHGFLIAVSNATKERFSRDTIKSLLDAARLLRRGFDWGDVARRARRARLGRPLAATLSLLVELGLRADLAPPELARLPGALARFELRRILRDVEAMFPHEPGMIEKSRRELLLTAEPETVLYRAWFRLRGLVQPHTGDPRQLLNAS
ncbi:MAG: nucleotidyltransferase family protein [Alphaproteobacteria bacterium]|nr:nucleotidyltransferase family protein [Alphaproteobacteria bacterium]